MKITLEYKKIHADAVLPRRTRETDAGWDLVSIDGKVIMPSETHNFSTGLIVTAPPGYYYTIEGRSGLARLGIKPFRGIIDSAYNGILFVALTNHSDKPYEILKGDRIAQMILHSVVEFQFVEVEDFTHKARGENGFGSSGR